VSEIGLRIRACVCGGALQRIETLEEGLELLLKAQDLQWREESSGRAKDRCCSGCVIC
jgi:hypothetical protein